MKVMASQKGAFFCAMNSIPYYQKDTLPLNSEPKVAPKEFVTPKVELSENIQKFDRKPRVYTENPFSFKGVTKRRVEESPELSPTASEMITTPLYNEVGKILGVDTHHDWGKSYDRVYEVVELAKAKSGIKDPNKLSAWIYQQLHRAPSLGNKRIDDVYIYLKMSSTPKPQVKPVAKKVVRPKENTEEFVSNWMKGVLNVS